MALHSHLHETSPYKSKILLSYEQLVLVQCRSHLKQLHILLVSFSISNYDNRTLICIKSPGPSSFPIVIGVQY